MCLPSEIDAIGATYRMLRFCYERDVKPHHRQLEGMRVIMDAITVKALIDVLARVMPDQEVAAPRRRGRPKGSKNKVKP